MVAHLTWARGMGGCWGSGFPPKPDACENPWLRGPLRKRPQGASVLGSFRTMAALPRARKEGRGQQAGGRGVVCCVCGGWSGVEGTTCTHLSSHVTDTAIWPWHDSSSSQPCKNDTGPSSRFEYRKLEHSPQPLLAHVYTGFP